MRPRANTISHVDGAALGLMAAANSSAARSRQVNVVHGHHPSLNNLPGPGNYEFRGMSTATGHHGSPHGLPKLETQGLPIDMSAVLRTAPAYGGFPNEYAMEAMFSPGNTINPAQLHFSDSPHSMAFDTPTSPFSHHFSIPAGHMVDDDGSYDWINGFDNQMNFNAANENAISGSSPSAISTGSPGGISEVMVDGSNHPHTSAPWQSSMLSQQSLIPEYAMDLGDGSFPTLIHGPLSPKTLDFATDNPFSSNPGVGMQTPMSQMNANPSHIFPPSLISSGDTPTTTASVGSGGRHSSITSVSTDSITDATRQALISSLSSNSIYNHRKYSQTSTRSPLPPGFTNKTRNAPSVSLPSTYDLQRYVAAYIQYFHPHLPFLHIPSLSFDSPAFTSNIRSNGHSNYNSGIAGGGGCLILAMAAIGALYEFDNTVSKELFDLAKKMIQIYLEERRKADLSAAISGSPNHNENSAQNTPLWLVQSMLLNVIYGHNCGDKTSADIASTHCAALVSLARAAELAKPLDPTQLQNKINSEDIHMTNNGWNLRQGDDLSWYSWKLAEERKRTLYTVFILSSMLVSAYNHPPALTNSEIRLDLPCDEDLWAAETPDMWYAMGGKELADHRTTSFGNALSTLLTAGHRHQYQPHQMSQAFCQQFSGGALPPGSPQSELQTSAFGCLILINALHNYIWETRQRHLGRQWTTAETEAMHARIEPALAAWQATWAANPHHSLERPNPFGFGPLSADSIPLLDLAYVRLFVNLGRSKEAFWHRDFDEMANELARGTEIIQHADHSPNSPSNTGELAPQNDTGHEAASVKTEPATDSSQSGQSSKRERHLRKAAFHAAHSLAMSDKLGVTFADFNSRELPIQSAMCAFDCAQVLAEWVSTIQERVGKYLGILGRDPIDFESVPGIMLVEQEDIALFAKIDDVLAGFEHKTAHEYNSMGGLPLTMGNSPLNLKECGYGSKILLITAYMLDKAAVWPGKNEPTKSRRVDPLTTLVTRLMSRSLETQAAHMKDRAENSLVKSE